MKPITKLSQLRQAVRDDRVIEMRNEMFDSQHEGCFVLFKRGESWCYARVIRVDPGQVKLRWVAEGFLSYVEKGIVTRFDRNIRLYYEEEGSEE